MITEQNWTHCIYKDIHSEEMAQISIGADWKESAITEQYFVAHVDENHLGIDESCFSKLDQAIGFINTQFKDWEFIDLEIVNQKNKKEGGCGTCSAH